MNIIKTDKAPKAIGPYSQAIMTNNMLFVSGQLGLNPSTMELPESILDQAYQSFTNIGEILKEAGMSYDDVVKTTVFITDISKFSAVNEVYATFFKGNPARSCVEVSKLPKGALIECEVIAVKR
ncbi:MAG: RidA family protein [Acholeplasmatales bacterium]|nr:RidA family protein [Acholeplasmatales bacterium]